MQSLTPALAILSVLAVSACGPAPRVGLKPINTSDWVDVTTEPAGAIATNYRGRTCITPCRLALPRAEGGSILIHLAGYRTERHFIGAESTLENHAQDDRFHPSQRDPEDLAIDAAIHTLIDKGLTKRLDKNSLHVELAPLAKGEEDPLAPDVAISGDLFSSYRPITGERIPIDISKDDD